ncbi:UDP-N-acetylmuramate dehydrogenase [Melioribacteraceae bacterium 4301-Me]|uniref:UDP-N-acetylmuramate dehydrogenase n=1 Tax=Pyranulibacter aquaticus TaxID=3163344 RepID=UPI003595AB2C
MILKENYSLKDLNTFKVDVKAKLFCEINDEETLFELFCDSNYSGLAKYVIGGGSNILFTKDYDGLIVKNNLKGKKILEENGESILIEISAGEIWDDFVKYCTSMKYYGVENLSLIPGCVGAAPVQNIGAYGVELKDVFYSLRGIDLLRKQVRTLTTSECKFDYRDSIFKNEYKDKFIITSVTLRLSKLKKFSLDYPPLKESVKNINKHDITLQTVREKVISIRKNKLPDPNVLGNAGSFFKNPIVTYSQVEFIKKDFSDLPFYKFKDNYYKLPAAWLIEKCGWKGKRIGNVGCYEKQPLIIVNFGNATPAEILDLADKVALSVKKRFDVELLPEVNIV